ncbi:MAG: S9 family peptidase [Gammaproteobacteria bacterium]|nr:S9 family peptidase [Gammaproteobacteria bacterium]
MKYPCLIVFRWLTVLSVLFATAVNARNDALRALEIDDYFALEYIGSPRVSPDGRWVAYAVSGQDLGNDRHYTRVWMVSMSGGDPLPMTAKGSSAWSPRWSPDGKRLSFIAAGSDGSSQVFMLNMRGGEREQLTNVAGGVEGYEWSPDGSRLALVRRDPEEDKGPGPWVIDRLTFKQDYVGYLDRRRGHLYAYDIDSSAMTQITAGDYEDYAPAWSPDGSMIAFVSNRTEEPDGNWNSDIWLVDPDVPHDEQEPVRVTTNPWSDDSPVWHPDGERIGYITTYTDRTDVPGPYLQTKVAIIRIGEDDPVLLTTEALDRKANGPAFSPDGRHLYVMLEDDGQVQLAGVSVADGAISRLVTGQVRVEEIALAPDGSIVAVVSEPKLPADLFVVDASSQERRRLTRINDDLLNSIFLSDVEELRFPTLDGTVIQTFVYKPASFDPKRRYPTILWLHGGQESQYDYGFNFRVQLFQANGYVVVMPNVRGSGGRGQAFALALNKAYGTKDVEDVIAATDYVIDQGYVDPDRLGVGGWSSGGTLTNFVIARTNRFAGAISGASVGWYTTTYGHDPYLSWWNTELGKPWENRDLWDRISPFMYVENITTPTLFIHGEKDWNQPVIHSEQMYQAMKQLGREASLVVYPDAYHGIRRPVYHRDLLMRFVGWFDRYVKNPKPDR